MVHRQSVFKDESRLDINYVPQKLPHREMEYRLLMEFFGFVTRCPERMTQRVIVTGDVGTGKTALTQRFGENISSDAGKRGIKFRYIHINCREYRGNLASILHHAVAIFQPNYPARGYSAEDILKAIMQVLEEENSFIILALDEFDSLIEKEGADAVYKLTRLQEISTSKTQRISFIFIMRDLAAVEQLDISARSTMQNNILRLERYGKAQLMDILSDRVSMAFELGSVSEDVVELISELAFTETGNARFGIELLWRSGKYADAESAGSVGPECVRMAVSSIVPGLRKSELVGLSVHEKLFLLALARYFKDNDEAYVSISEAEKCYTVVCEEFGEKPNGYTQIWNYTQSLSKVGILQTESTPAHGRPIKISLPTIPATELEKELSASLSAKKARA